MAVKQHIKDEERHPLQTRHVFLDTQVYRSLSFNIANPAMQQLRNHVSEYRIVLHVTDITLKEIELQITELVADKRRQLVETEKHLNRWRKQAPQNSPKGKFDFDAEALAAELMSTLSNFILTDCNATLHNASVINAVPVFEKYFKRLPPFDDEKSRKEFPDAFVIECLGDWASSNNQDMYVTTRDAAFLRAVDQHSRS